MQEPERKRRTGEMRTIGGKTYGFEKDHHDVDKNAGQKD